MKSDFVKCGILGWCIEIVWTAFNGIKSENNKFIGHTSIIMFPIYGLASVIKPLSKNLKNKKIPTVIRGTIYTIGIFTVELITGSILKKTNNCPWDYSDKKYNINGVVRIDYAPLWFVVGLLFEKILDSKECRTQDK